MVLMEKSESTIHWEGHKVVRQGLESDRPASVQGRLLHGAFVKFK